MKKPSRFLRFIGVAGLLSMLLASAFSTSMVYAGAPDPDPSDGDEIGDIWDGTEPLLVTNEGGIFFPWVGNDDESTGLGPADTSTSVMNINDESAVVFAWVGTGGEVLGDTGAWDVVGPFFLSPWASKTFTAADLGIAEGGGAPVHFAGYNFLSGVEICDTVLGGALEAGVDVNGNGECTDVEVFIGTDQDDPTDPALCVVDDANGDPAPTYDEAVLGLGTPGGGLNNDGDCNDAEGGVLTDTVFDTTVLGGYAKQAVDGETLPYTTAADSSVSGYNSLSGFELIEFDDWYFPIVQTNVGPGGAWNSILRIANFGQEVDGEIGNVGAAAVTVSFFPADDAQGSLDTGFQLQFLVNTGETIHIDISDYLPEGYVGSAHVYSDSAVFAMVDRVKVGYGAWITNTASNAPHTVDSNITGALGQYVLFAPDVRTDFFGWNTGINVANLVNEDNNINIQYFNMFGNAPSTLTRRLAPQGMTYFYDPAQAPQDGSAQDPTADVNSDIIGSALIWSEFPVAVAVDATKYPESTTELDPNVFQAMSYNATANVYTQQAFPLVQKGNPTDGTGATSGINIMNPNATAAQATVWWVNPSGFGADNFGTSAVAIPGFANGFVYTMTQGNLPNGFFGSAVMSSTIPVAAVTTQVDYQVEWDGTAVWNGYNPCGYYRDAGVEFFDDTELTGFDVDYNCYLGDPFNTQGGQVTKIFTDGDTGEPITGVEVTLYNEAAFEQIYLGNEDFPGIPWIATGTSNVSGEIEWTNVPVGSYWLEITGAPDNDDPDILNAGLCEDFLDTGDDVDEDGDVDAFDFFLEFGFYCAAYQYFGVGDIEGPFTLLEGEDLVIENELEPVLAEKVVELGDDAADVPVCLVEAEDGDDVFDPLEDTEAVDCDFTDADGTAEFFDIEPGWYFVTVNYGFEDVDGVDFDPVAGFTPAVFGPEFFDLGGIYENDLDVAPAFGNIQKVLVLPDFLVAAIGSGAASLTGNVQIFGPGGFEVEGNVQTDFLDPIGPGDEDAYSITDFDVPVGGPYTLEEDLEITWDDDGDPLTPPVVFTFSTVVTETDPDGQVICDDFLDLTSDCDPVEEDPDDPLAPVPILVYEDLTTRVFNDFAELVDGQVDLFVRDEETDLQLAGATVCAFDEDLDDPLDDPLIECLVTDLDGQVEFTLPNGAYSFTATHPDYETQGSGSVLYLVGADAANFGLDDELGDLDPVTGAQLDYELALDPTDTAFDVQANVGDATEPDDGVDGVTVFLFLADPADVPGGAFFGGCLSPLGAQAIVVTSTQAVGDDADNALVDASIGPDEPGIAEFGLDPDEQYCITLDPNGDGTIQTITGIDADVFPQSAGPNPPGGNNDFDAFDRNDDIDLVVNEGALGIIDAQYFLDPDGAAGALPPAATNGVFVSFFVADAALDVPGLGGTCGGAFLGASVTGPQVVNPPGGLVDGIASLSVDSTLTFCVSVAPVAGVNQGFATTGIVIDDMDQDDDIDATLDDSL